MNSDFFVFCFKNVLILLLGAGSTVPRKGFNLSVILASLLDFLMLGCRHSLLEHSSISCFSRGRLLLRTPGPVHFGLAYVLLVETNPFPELVVIFLDYAPRTSLGTFSILLSIECRFLNIPTCVHLPTGGPFPCTFWRLPSYIESYCRDIPFSLLIINSCFFFNSNSPLKLT